MHRRRNFTSTYCGFNVRLAQCLNNSVLNVPSRGLLRDYESSDWPLFQALILSLMAAAAVVLQVGSVAQLMVATSSPPPVPLSAASLGPVITGPGSRDRIATHCCCHTLLTLLMCMWLSLSLCWLLPRCQLPRLGRDCLVHVAISTQTGSRVTAHTVRVPEVGG